jgi:hypothetical protein
MSHAKELIEEICEAKKKPPTKAQWDSVFNATKQAYNNSYAMMVDDAMKGFEPKANKLGLGAYWDGAVFGFIFRKIKAHVGKLTPDDIEELNDLFYED